VVLALNPALAPTKAAVFPLVKKDGMPEIAEKLQAELRAASIPAFYDQSGAIGRRYRRQDEVGTPWCITVDGESTEKQTVTIRDRDSLAQVRVGLDKVVGWIRERLAS
jgi:glycyl-tRNA synthetase